VAPEQFAAALVEGLVPERDASDAVACERLQQTLWRHGVVCVRQPAPLDDGRARALASMIGPIKDPVARARDGRALRYSEDRQVIDAGFVMTDEIREALGDVSFGGDDVRPGLFETFHTDDSYVECPAAATVLHARELPAGGGGDTCFLDRSWP
jgi:alpha-ketoglutarate-dependent taurine dioxygenase